VESTRSIRTAPLVERGGVAGGTISRNRRKPSVW
jgi:hypothetical protein